MLRFLILFTLLLTSPAFAITNWNKAVAASVDNLSIWPATVQSQWSVLDTLLSNYRRGLNLIYKNASSLTVQTGEVTVSSLDGSVRLFLQLTANTDITTANLDVGAAFASSTTYSIYAGTSSITAAAPTLYISLNAAAPTGVTYYFKLGSFTTDSAGAIAQITDASVMSGFAAAIPKSCGSNNLATTDGILLVEAFVTSSNNSTFSGAGIFTDSSVSPSTLVARAGSQSSTTSLTTDIYYPIKKGNYYRAATIGGSGGQCNGAAFIPMGT